MVVIRLFFVPTCEWIGHKIVFYFVFLRNISVARTNTVACCRVEEGCNGLLATCIAATGADFSWVANFREVRRGARDDRIPIWNMLICEGVTWICHPTFFLAEGGGYPLVSALQKRGPLSRPSLIFHADAGIHQLALTATRRRCSQMMAPNSRKPGIHISSLRQRSVGALTARIS